MDEDEFKCKLQNAIFMLTCFGDRFINVDDSQAKLDLENRDYLVSCFNCILDLFDLLKKKGD